MWLPLEEGAMRSSLLPLWGVAKPKATRARPLVLSLLMLIESEYTSEGEVAQRVRACVLPISPLFALDVGPWWRGDCNPHGKRNA